MHEIKTRFTILFIALLIFVIPACSTPSTPLAVPTETALPTATATHTGIPSETPVPTSTPRPTATPNIAATEHMEDLQAEVNNYFDLGYLDSTDGRFREYDDFEVEWAQLNWYQWQPLTDSVSDFYISAHFEWSSAYQSPDISGCGFVFGLQENSSHYAVFLDRSQVLFIISNGSGTRPIGKTRGSGAVKIDDSTEADFTLIVNDGYSYVLVDDNLIGEYTLSQSQPMRGKLGLTVLSGTNKDYGTRCRMTDLRAWIPE